MEEKLLHESSLVDAEVSAITDEGSGVLRHEGMVIFAPFTAPGDLARVRITKVAKNCAYAELKKILKASELRAEPDCPSFGRCGGCALRHITYQAELEQKRIWVQEHIRRIGGFDLEPLAPIASPKAERYRNKAIYPAEKNRKGEPIFGFYARRTHALIPCMDCKLQPESFAAILEAVRKYTAEAGVTLYDEAEHTGALRAVFIRRAEVTGEIMAAVVVNSHSLPRTEKLVEYIRAAAPEVKSVVMNINCERTNVVLGRSFVTLWGADKITDRLCGLKIELSPASFYQVNHAAAELLYGKAAEFAGLTGSETLLDLYCGAGTIGLSMASKARRVIGVEIVPQAIENARQNAISNGIENAEFICADAGDAASLLAERGERPDVILLDPPRKGCSKETLEAVAGMKPERIVMISCNTATMARDFKVLAELGYRPVKAQPVDMFPRTANIECVALLEKERDREAT